MITDDAISRIIARTKVEMTGVDQDALRVIMEDVLSSYDVTLKEGLEAVTDLPEKIKLYQDAKRLDGLSEKTLKNNAYHLNRFAKFLQKKVAAITTIDLRKFLAHLMETRNLKNTTLESEKSILKAFFAWLEEEEYIGKNPAKKIKPTKVDKRIRKALTLEELELMRDACTTTRQRCMFELFYSTGVRLDELHSVDIGHLNWQDNSIRVIGKGNKERVVYFSDRAKIYLKRYIAERGMLGTDALFITSRKPHARMGHKSIQNEIKAIARAAGISKSVYPHLLRHSFATQGLKSGMSLNVIHDLLGHEKLDTTLIYARTDQETAQYEYKKYHNQ
jgi:integrase/recombinase XerD